MTIRWGIVGAGKISSDFVNAINTFPGKGKQVVAAVAARDRRRAQAEEFAQLHNVPTVFDSYQAMAESDDTDVAYIGALNPDHFAVAKLFLENGKHVLCEKPMCLNLKQTQALVNIARRERRFLMESVWSRFAPAYLSLEKEIESGKLGDIILVEANVGGAFDSMDRFSKKEFGGGAVLNVGVYVLQFAQFIFKDEPTKVTSVGVVNEHGVDVSEQIILEYNGGRRAVLNCDVTVKVNRTATITGTKGRVMFHDPFFFPNTFIRTDGSVEEFPLHTSNIPYNYHNSAGLAYEAVEVAKCIREGLLESPRLTHADSIIISKLQDIVRKQVGVFFDVDDEEFS